MSRVHSLILLSCVILFGLLSCAGTAGPTLASYRTDCAKASDCVAVALHDVCTACHCPDSAINGADEAKYMSDFSAARSQCGMLPVCLAECAVPTVACNAGQCALGAK